MEAEERFQRGLARARAQSWDSALAEFLASRELFPTRSATRNAAVSLGKLQRYAECVELYEVLIREFGQSMPKDQLDSVRTEMREALSHVGEIAVAGADPGVVVVVDGQQRGVTPLQHPIRVNEGTHVVRLSKPDFEPVEQTFVLAGGQRKLIGTRLQRLTEVGTLVVREASGATLDLLVDAAVVGKTPWSGSLKPGTHAIQLQGAGDVGTPPSSVIVRPSATTTLVLRAVKLEATVHIEPTPSSATVFVDGVPVGAGVWEGRLPSGEHRFEVAAPGHLPFVQRLNLQPQSRRVLLARLERDTTSPLWRAAAQPYFYAEASAGAVLARSFRGGADDNCKCRERSRPLGIMAVGRVGYALVSGLGVELGAGFLTMSERMTRTVDALGDAEWPSWSSENYQDSTRLTGPLATIGAAYRVLRKTPVTARVSFGLAALTSATSNAGTFVGSTAGGDSGPSLEHNVSVAEASQRLLTPFGSTELRIGYRFTRRITADFGVAVLLLLPPSRPRADNTTFGGGTMRAPVLRDAQGDPVAVLQLPSENVASDFVAVSPSVAFTLAF